MDFGEAIKVLRANGRATRSGWNGKGMWIAWFDGGWWRQAARQEFRLSEGRETLGFVVMKTADEKLIPWIPSQADLLANDWKEVF